MLARGLAESRIIGHAYVRGVPSRFGSKLSLSLAWNWPITRARSAPSTMRTATVQIVAAHALEPRRVHP